MPRLDVRWDQMYSKVCLRHSPGNPLEYVNARLTILFSSVMLSLETFSQASERPNDALGARLLARARASTEASRLPSLEFHSSVGCWTKNRGGFTPPNHPFVHRVFMGFPL